MKKSTYAMETNRRVNKIYYRHYLDTIWEHDSWGPLNSRYNSDCWRDRSWKRHRKTQYK